MAIYMWMIEELSSQIEVIKLKMILQESLRRQNAFQSILTVRYSFYQKVMRMEMLFMQKSIRIQTQL